MIGLSRCVTECLFIRGHFGNSYRESRLGFGAVTAIWFGRLQRTMRQRATVCRVQHRTPGMPVFGLEPPLDKLLSFRCWRSEDLFRDDFAAPLSRERTN